GRSVWRESGFELVDLRLRQLDAGRRDVLLHVLHALGAGNRHDVRAFCQQPCERELGGRAALSSRHRLEALDQRKVVTQVLALEAWQSPTDIVSRERLSVLQGAGQESPPQRTERDAADAELAAHRDNI